MWNATAEVCYRIRYQVIKGIWLSGSQKYQKNQDVIRMCMYKSPVFECFFCRRRKEAGRAE